MISQISKILKIFIVFSLFSIFSQDLCIHSRSLIANLTQFNKKNRSMAKQLFNNFFPVIDSQFYRSKQLSAKELENYVRKYGIKTIINLRGDNPGKKWYDEEKALAQKLGIAFYSIPMSAVRLPSKENLKKLIELIETAPRPVYFHCAGGADRTGTAAALVKMLIQGESNIQAATQLALKYGHRKLKNGVNVQDFFIKNLWQGRDWALNNYDPTAYPQFN